MTQPHNYLCSSIGKKQILALTGFGLIGFTATHLLGNLLIFAGSDAFNYYAHILVSNKFLIFAELGLIGIFILHVVLGLVLSIQNKAARPQKYYLRSKTGRGETFASLTMPYSGFIILVFIILHLINFKYGSNYTATVDGVQMRDIFRTVIEYFANPAYVAWYVFAMCIFGFHTAHGLQSVFQTWGFNHPKYTPKIKIISALYGLTVAVGFSALAIFCHFQN